MNGGHGLLGIADARAFLGRLTRLDPTALVRLRSVPDPSGAAERVALWARLPWRVLVTRTVPGHGPGDATVAAAELLPLLAVDGDVRAPDGGAGGGLPARRDAGWRWSLPPDAGSVVETIAAEDLLRVDSAAAGTLRSVAAGRQFGDRAIRDALLDHIAIVVTDVDAGPVEIPQRLVQAVLRMGFLGPSGQFTGKTVGVRVAARWTGLAAPYGTAWLRRVSDTRLMSLHVHTNG